MKMTGLSVLKLGNGFSLLSAKVGSDKEPTPIWLIVPRDTPPEDQSNIDLDDPKFRFYVNEKDAQDGFGEACSGEELTGPANGYSRPQLKQKLEMISTVH